MLLAVCPGCVFVVEGLVAEAAVEDADEAVGERSECTVVGGTAGAVFGRRTLLRLGWR